jgi:hypothetical protein
MDQFEENAGLRVYLVLAGRGFKAGRLAGRPGRYQFLPVMTGRRMRESALDISQPATVEHLTGSANKVQSTRPSRSSRILRKRHSNHSYFKAITGSTLVALRAGMKAAMKEMAISNNAVPPKASGSAALTP